jgi:hypothetical protein
MSGKWDDPAVPKAGWICTEVYDSCEDGDELHRVCDMCEVALIRYVHVMVHDDWEPLEAGCICAGHMECDEAAAMHRENAARRRDRFPGHKNWRRTERGNARLNVDGLRLIVYRHGSGWRVGVADRVEDGEEIWGRRDYASEREARRAAFDAMVYAKSRGLGL